MAEQSNGGLSWHHLKHLALPVLAVAGAILLDRQGAGPAPSVAQAAEWPSAGYGPRNQHEALTRIADQLDLGEERAANAPGQWLRQESLARALMARSRLGTSYDDLYQADAVLAQARAAAPKGSGPLLTSAVEAMMVHRLNDTQTALDAIDGWAVPAEPAEQAEAAGLRGDVAFYRGRMGEAQADYARSQALSPGAGIAYRLANLAKARGDFDEAIAQFRLAGTGRPAMTPYAQASTALQIGAVELARGNHAEARAWFTAADRQFPGNWLFEAHLAQAKAVDGDLSGAIADMRRIALRAPAAEVMDALAMLLRADGQAAESRQWAARAGTAWQRRLQQLPEAAYGHAVEHELVFGDPARALDLAQRDVVARPYGEARILLATALVLNGRADDALSQVELAHASGWRSAPLEAVRAQALELAGRSAEAARARDAARRLNPRIFDPITALVWFSHG